MLTNYELQQYFLDMIKEFSISNPDKQIDKNFIYSRLMVFNIQNIHGPYQDVSYFFDDWQERYKLNKNIDVFKVPERKSFLWFTNGQIRGNEIKLYIPLGKNYLKEGANQLFDFISTTNIEHQSKIANVIRNDNIVIRVNSMEDAKTIIDYVYNNPYLMEGLMRVNPFLPTCNGVGITMDNSYSYNMTVCTIISDFLTLLKQYNKLDLFTVEELNKYIKNSIYQVSDYDLKDIYSLISKVTDPNFKLLDFVDHANYKLCDKYTYDRKKIVDPKFYFEQAIKSTDMLYPKNTKAAILSYLKNNPNLFAGKGNEVSALLKYVHPSDVISLMRSKLIENNIPIPNNDNDLIDQYLSILLNKPMNKSIEDLFKFLKDAYINTMNAYDIMQSRYALRALILNKDAQYFTNRFNDRHKIKEEILQKDILKIVLNNIDLKNLNINNIDEVINRFEDSIGINPKFSQNTY